MGNWLASLVSVVVAIAALLESSTRPSARDADAFHARVRAAVERVPATIGEWSAVEIELPAAAQALLQPNASVGRRYVHARTGQSASLLLIQCRDTRDMSGHYPPACYPGQGWVEATPVARERVVAGGVEVPLAVYHFEKSQFERRSALLIYDFFILPERGLADDMASVRRSASDPRRRHLGAAQVQVLFDASTEGSGGGGLVGASRREVLVRFIEEVVPVIREMGAIGEAKP